MFKLVKIIAPLAAAAVFLSGCTATIYNNDNSTTQPEPQVTALQRTDEFSTFDLNDKWDNTATAVTLEGSTAMVSGSGASAENGSVTVTKAGTYVFSGSLTDGSIIVSLPESDKAQLVLNGVTVRSASTAAIIVEQADKVVLTLADGSTNTLSDSALRGDDDAEKNACIFSKEDLTVNGSGTLEVNGRYNNGIASNDDLKIVSGTLSVNAVNNAVKGKDSVAVKSCNLTVTGADDAIKSDNDEDAEKGYIYIENGAFDLTCSGDAVDAQTGVTILGGSYKIVTGGGSANGVNAQQNNEVAEMFGGGKQNGGRVEMPTGDFQPGNRHDGERPSRPDAAQPGFEEQASAETDSQPDVSTKGIKGGSEVTISGGEFDIDSCDDCIHTNGSLSVSGGSFTLNSGDDGIHADVSLYISGGTIDVQKSYEGVEAQNITISGGEVSVVSSDDGLNAAGGNDGSSVGGRPGMNGFGGGTGTITLSGGYVFVNASGDGIDSNGSVIMSGGTAVVYGPTNSGNGALDYDSSFTVTGGTLLACGASGMAQKVTSDTQGVVSCSATVSADTLLTLTDSAGNILISFASPKQYQNVVFTSPDVKQGASLKALTGGTNSGSVQNGVYSGGTVSGTNSEKTVTAD